jgi:WD40 repeat protein
VTAALALPTTWTHQVDDAPVALAVSASQAPGQRVAVLGAGGQLDILDRADGSLLSRVIHPDWLLTAAWSPDGSVLAVGGPKGAALWRAGSGLKPLEISGWCGTLSWADRSRVAIAAGRQVHVFDANADTGPTPTWSTPRIQSTVSATIWLREGRELAVAGYGGIRCFQRGRSAPSREFPFVGSLLSVAATSNGRWLATGNQDASIQVWRARDGYELEMAGFPTKVTQVAFDSSGRWLAANGAPDVTVWDFSGAGPGGTTPRLLSAHEAGAGVLAWHPGRAELATGGKDGLLALWLPERDLPGKPQAPYRTAQFGATLSALAWAAPESLLIATADGAVHHLGPGPS